MSGYEVTCVPGDGIGPEIMAATKWLPHSCRSAISTLGKVNKITSEKDDTGTRRYRIAE